MPETTNSLNLAGDPDAAILRAASSDSDDWDDVTWAAWFRTAERCHGDGFQRTPLFTKVGAQQVRAAALEKQLAEYEVLNPQQCPKGLHADWLIDSEYTHTCPWCRIAELEAENAALVKALGLNESAA